MKNMQSSVRISHLDSSDNFIFQRTIFAYYKAAELVSGDVLELETGRGYGIKIISPRSNSFITIDDIDIDIDLSNYPNVEFHKMMLPPIKSITSASIDYVVSLQTIEHIKRDFELMKEINRILRPGGKLIISTPNAKSSLTRNPWHIREYTADEFKNLLGSFFSSVESYGVFGRDNVVAYFNKNREYVRDITRFDILNIQHWLPRWVLKAPYRTLNRINRRRLLVKNRKLTTNISRSDYFLDTVNDSCLDLFYIATK